MKKIVAVAIMGLVIVSLSCKKKDMIPGTYNSNDVKMGNGKVHSWMTFDEEGTPVALGFTLNDDALNGLPDSTQGSGHAAHNAIELPLPPEIVSITPFNHIVINYNPTGHQPKPIYAAPHFDFHFYTMTSSDRKKIPTYDKDSTGFANRPAAAYLPANYVNPPLVVSADEQMGTHWVDVTSPELQPGGTFTETFVYGSFGGKVNFLEPMITYSYFKAITSWSRSIPQPAKVSKSGYYPTTISVTHSNGSYTLSLENLVFRTAS